MELVRDALPGPVGPVEVCCLDLFCLYAQKHQIHDFISLMVLIFAADIRIQESQLSFLAAALENPTYWTASQLRLHLLSSFVETTARVKVKSLEK